MNTEKILDLLCEMHDTLTENQVFAFSAGTNTGRVAMDNESIMLPYDVYIKLKGSDCDGDIIEDNQIMTHRQMEYRGKYIFAIKWK